MKRTLVQGLMALAAILAGSLMKVHGQDLVFSSNGKIDYPLKPNDIAMLDSIQHKTFLFFMGEHHPTMGIVKDRSTPTSPASIAATGFGIPCFAIGAERHWISREEAARITLNILKFFYSSEQGTGANVTGYKGFYYHFLEMKNGTREWKCELSTVDTGILMMGVIFARNYYSLDTEAERMIRKLAGDLLGRIDWNFVQMSDSGRFANVLSMGWTPEKGLHDFGWSGYNEALFLYILAAGNGMKDAERSYRAWLKTYQWYTTYPQYPHVAFPPLFGHQFSQAFIDFRGLADAYMTGKGIDYFENSRRATYAQRRYAIDNPGGWTGYDSLCWGTTACDGPGEQYNRNGKKFIGYAGRGASGPDYNYFDDGTLAPYGPISSIPFAPEIVIPTIRAFNERYGKQLWGRYGYFDAFNPTAGWVDVDCLGIDQGPMLMMLENFRTGLIWNQVMKDPIIQKGLNRLGFNYLKKKLDDFESEAGWSFIRSDGVNLKLTTEPGRSGHAIRFDYDFTKGSGYGGIQKKFAIDLPDNFVFSFWIKAESPSNNMEFKLLDSTGTNVWWVNNRNFDFPREWKQIRIRKRHIGFAWGPAQDKSLKRIDRIEFTIASFVGGKGTIWLDDFQFEALPPEATAYPVPTIGATTSAEGHLPGEMTDGNPSTSWRSRDAVPQKVTVDFMTRREFGGLQIDWQQGLPATAFDIQLSTEGSAWEKVYSVPDNRSGRSFIRLPEAEARYLRINLLKSNSDKGFGIDELRFLEVRNSLSTNDFLIYTAKNSKTGDYPRSFLEQASYWTLTGVSGDVKEALINEDGMVEVEKARFSIEPMVRTGDSLWNWSNVQAVQTMGSGSLGGFDYEPTVAWACGGVELKTSVTAHGEANRSSLMNIRYSLRNTSGKPADPELYLLVRPFQVNPYYQFLNLAGGVGKIGSIREEAGQVFVDDKVIAFSRKFDGFGCGAFDEGNPVDGIRQGKLPASVSVTDPNRLATGVIRYILHLKPGEVSNLDLAVPFYELPSSGLFEDPAKTTESWKEKVSHVKFNLPSSANRIIDTYRSNLAYILVNRDKVGIQPGSRSYERSWIRDGALTSSALLKSGIVKEVREFIDWYAAHQFESGKVPCVVDFRGPDPVPENDSHGEFIYLIREYFNFTRDTAFLKALNGNVMKAVDYIGQLIAERSTDHYRLGNDSIRAQYGLVPESISHEGYSAKPMHSYWDDFFIMKGLKDAAEIQKILGEQAYLEKVTKMRDTFRENLYHSIDLAMKFKKIDYIPGCAELGDFDATSTTIALTPCNEMKNLPKPQVYNTFDKYYQLFRNRRDGKTEWENYTPYENRLIGSFILLDQPERAHELIDFFLHDQRPQGWNAWAEVVWKDVRTPRYIGDMPHTWVGSDFINAIRTMFVYENEYDQTLVVAPALYQDWIDAPQGMSVENLPTYYGELSYSIQKKGNRYVFDLSGRMNLPANGISIRNFNGSKRPVKVTVNGKETDSFTDKAISVKSIPARVVISY